MYVLTWKQFRLYIWKALKEGRTPDYSDYKDFKIKTENIGHKLLSKLGWKEGQGLGKDNQGIVDPVNKLIKFHFFLSSFII